MTEVLGQGTDINALGEERRGVMVAKLMESVFAAGNYASGFQRGMPDVSVPVV